VLTELVALIALVMAGYGAYIAAKWDRRASKLLASTPEAKEQLLEEACRVATASMVNSVRILLQDPTVLPLIDKGLEKHGPRLASAAASGYLSASQSANPGRALAEKRWGPSRGGKVIASAATADDPIGAAVNAMLPQLIERFMAGQLGGAPSGITPGASTASGGGARAVEGWKVPP